MTDVPPAVDSSPAPPAGADAAAIRADTLALLVRQSFPAVFLSIAIGGVMCWTLWERIDTAALCRWLGLLGVSTLIRLAMFAGYFRARPHGQRILAWERPYAITLILSSLVWGLGGLFLIPPGREVEQGIVLFFLIGMVGGSMVTYSSHRAMTIAAMTAVILPCTLWLYAQPGRMALGMAVAATVFMAGAVRSTGVLADAMRSRLLMSYQLRRAHAIADGMAHTDALTGICNRRAFIERGEQTLRLCQREARPVSALLIDVDHFKKVNDAHGHAAGDLVLKQVGALLVAQCRQSDVCGRLGGEEFAVLLANTDAAAAAELAERFRLAIAAVSIPWQDQALGVTVSIGVAARSYDLETLLHHADMAMYRAKAGGRNATVCQDAQAAPA